MCFIARAGYLIHGPPVFRILGVVAKESANPLLVQDQPWENRLDNSYPNIVHSPGDPLGSWRLWYSNHAPTAYFITANSSDGLTWHKPKLGLYNLTGSHGCKLSPELCSIGTANNIVSTAEGVGVMRDGPSSALSTRRYP